MAISFEQFKIVLTDAEARTELGLNISEEQLTLLQNNEARAISFFEKWNQSSSPGSSSIDPTATGIPVILVHGPRFSGAAITGFIFAILGFLAVEIPSPTIVFPSLIGLFISIAGLTGTKSGAYRGHGLAVAGTILASLALVADVGVLILRASGRLA